MTVSTSLRDAPFARSMRFVFEHWARQPGRVGLIAGAIALATLADVAIPVFAGRLVDAFASADRDAGLDAALWSFAAIVTLSAMIAGFRALAFMTVIPMTQTIMRDAAAEAFARVQRLSTDWHANSFAGSTVRKVTRGMWAIDQFNDLLLMALAPSLLVLVASTAVLAAHWPLMGFVTLVGAVAYVATTVSISLLWVAPAAQLSNAWDTRLGGVMADAVTCNAVVKAFGAEAREERRLGFVMDKWSRRTTRTWRRGTWNGVLQNLILMLLRAATLGLGVWLWWTGQASAGDAAFLLTMFAVIHGYLRDVGMHVADLQRAVNDLQELVELHGVPVGVEDRPGAAPIVVGQGRIAFENVTFHYSGHATPLYRDLSVVIEGGERVGLVGRSGSGKTTFVKLVQRLYDATAGRVTIDGQDVAQATQASLRAQIAIVPQEPTLFHRSLAENIAYARPGATMAEIERAARLANAHGFISKLPKGYGTLVGERGVKLSGGERQRVAIARAFLADAPVLILDEATSSLDSESEAAIQEAIERLMVGRTTVVIAHRLSTVRAMDRILVFDAGRIVEQGDHDALVARDGGIYRRLFERQTGELAEVVAA
ncbi:ABC transporter ATP-binding protein [Methylopila turkensis]|uniref:Multidrug ABC transporter ATP-binding protein n=1 Tax=Methylopila turkensis TaxID=1437816 RepID=A0A9W6JPJ2_9HYPH|nr:ABC transporter ATP-binding protein [Methylopila turkensis]GLK79964.1 multidrug ABC transporter ATP-binding protein [Methylopila turkensis]